MSFTFVLLVPAEKSESAETGWVEFPKDFLPGFPGKKYKVDFWRFPEIGVPSNHPF